MSAAHKFCPWELGEVGTVLRPMSMLCGSVATDVHGPDEVQTLAPRGIVAGVRKAPPDKLRHRVG